MKNNIFTKINLISLFIFVSVPFIISIPQLYGIFFFKVNYSSLSSKPGLPYIKDETYSYAPQVSQIKKGYFMGDAYIWERRNSPTPFFNEFLSLAPISILSIITRSNELAFIISDFLFPLLILIIIFRGLRSFNYTFEFSLFASVAVIIIPFFPVVFPYFFNANTYLGGVQGAPLFFSRTPHPQISNIFLFIPVFITSLFIAKKKFGNQIFLPISIILSFFSSPFVASTVILGTIPNLRPIIKKINLKTLIIFFIISFVVLSPWLFNNILLNRFLSPDIYDRLTLKREFLFPQELRYIFIALILIWIGKDILSKTIAYYILSASLLIDMHQLILKRNIQADHWITRVIAPLATLAISIIFYKVLKSRNKAVWYVALVLVLIYGVSYQIDWINKFSKNFNNNENQKIINEINEKTGANDVIGTLSTDLNDEITARTGRWIYISTGDKSIISTKEEVERVCELSVLTNSSKEEAINALGYTLALAIRNQIIVNESEKLLTNCLQNKGSGQPKFKLDYLIKKDKNNNYELTPVK